MRHRFFLAFAPLTLAFTLGGPSLAQPPDTALPTLPAKPPPNGTSATAQVIEGNEGSIDGTTVDAPSASYPVAEDHSVFYRFTPATKAGGTATFAVSGYRDDNCRVFISAGFETNCFYETQGKNSVDFFTAPGINYWIQVTGWGRNTSPFTLEWSWTPLNRTYSFAGTVTIAKEPGSDLLVELSPGGHNDPILFSTTTDAHGQFLFKNIPAGDYQIVAHMPHPKTRADYYRGFASGVWLPSNLDGAPNAVVDYSVR